jgi:Mg-chelatase subunit ChlD/uncharacterized membrane protein
MLSARSLAALGRWRQATVLFLRTAIVVLLALALAETQLVWSNARLTVLYLLDQSLSVPEPQRRAMAEYVNAEVSRHRDAKTGDRAGAIVFAREAAIEYPAVEEDLRLSKLVESSLNNEYTNLAGALKLAQAAFPADSAKRVVLITDGNENLGSAIEEAQAMASRGIGIDVAPVRYRARGEIAVEKVVAPTDAQRGQPFDVRVLLNNVAENGAEDEPGSKAVTGRLRLYRRTKDREQMLTDQMVTVEPGKRVFTVRETIEEVDFFTYEARFVPDDPADDTVPQNNVATAFTNVRGQGQALLIEDTEALGQFDAFVELLRRANLNVVRMSTSELFTSLGELQPFDTVILADVPREAFTLDQIKILVTNTEQMGAGLIMLGGPNSFGCGGWAETPLEAAMPVDFQIHNAKVVPIGMLALVIDCSGSMTGDKLMMARAAAAAAVDVLSARDYISVTAFDEAPHVICTTTQLDHRASVKSKIAKIVAMGGTFMEPAILKARESFTQAKDAAVRHMIILTDGQTAGDGYENLARSYHKQGITLSTVAVGDDADIKLLKRMAQEGGGTFYHAKSPRMLPRIFQKEARMVSRPLIFERDAGMAPRVKFPHEILRGVEGAPPPITGFVLTDVKRNSLVEVALANPQPTEPEYQTLLASWTYGLGKAIVFTSDVSGRWTGAWSQWPMRDKFFSQMVRWSMRPVDNQANFTVTTDVRNGKAEFIVDALDRQQMFLDGLTMTARVVGPDLKPRDLGLRQVGPGRYVGEMQTDDAGAYLFSVVPGAGAAPLISGLNVSYSKEFLDRESNEPLLTSLAHLEPKGGEPGLLIDDQQGRGFAAALAGPSAMARTSGGAANGLEELLAFDTFRHNLPHAMSRQDIWPQLLVAACCLFFADVFVRRVQISFAWVPAGLALAQERLLRRAAAAPLPATISRLKSRKAEVVGTIDARRESAHFEPSAEQLVAAGHETLSEHAHAASSPRSPEPAKPQLGAQPEEPADNYTSRLLKAKKKVWEDRGG